MISKEVQEVAGTKLFVGTNPERTRQLTVYANTVDNVSINNAMVLPVPHPKSVIFHDLSNYKEFFTDCESCFSNQFLLKSSGMNFKLTDSDEVLPVYNVGSYVASIVPSLNDLHRVNSTVFDLSEGLDKMLQTHYSNPVFGFIVCKLAKGKETYHPFAYSCAMLDVATVFVPTKHYHVESSNYYANYNSTFSDKNIDQSLMFSSWLSGNTNKKVNEYDVDAKYADDWDHEIFLYNTNVDSNKLVSSMSQTDKVWNKMCAIKFERLSFNLDRKCRKFTRLYIKGKHPNIDMIVNAC